MIDPTGLDSCSLWNPSSWRGCFNNTVQTVNNDVVQPTENYVNTHVVQPVLNKVVNPILNKVIIPIVNEAKQLPGQIVSLGNSASNTLRNVGVTMWNRIVNEGKTANQGLSTVYDTISKAHITDVNKFTVGALKCAAVVGLVVGAFVAPEIVLPSISAAEMAVAVSGAAGAAYVYSGFSMAQYAKDWVDLGQTVVDFGNGCFDMASTVSFS